jgi:amino acid adenylation domain-containing protein/FkbH-like protein
MISSPTNTVGSPGATQKRALLAARLRRAASEPQQSPLSFAQQRLWFLDQLEPNTPLYNIASVARIKGRIDIQALQQSLRRIVARHETLRARFTCPDEDPLQVVDVDPRFRFEFVDLSGESDSESEARAQSLIKAELNWRFNLSVDHPLRVTLVRVRTEEYRLVVIVHHIVADEWSLRVFFHELATFYRACVSGIPASLPELPIQYSDYARWQRQRLQGDVLQDQLGYWKAQLQGYPVVTELPTDHPRGPGPTFRGRTASRTLDCLLAERLAELAKQRDSTLFMMLLAAFNVLVHRYTQQEDLIICSPFAGRSQVETEGLIGFFANTVPLRCRLTGKSTFEQVLAAVRESTLGAMANQEVPLERLVAELQPERTLNHLAFTKLMFSFQTGIEPTELPGTRLEFLEVEPELAKFELTMVLRQSGHGLVISIDYNRDLFEAETISRLLGHLETMLEAIATNPTQLVCKLPLLTAPERHQLLVEWNQTTRSYPRERCIHELFEAQVERAPHATAISWGQQKMSYGELNSRANQLARFLKKFRISPDTPVGLCADRSLETVVGMLAILKAGGAYVPLDAAYPRERLAFMLEDVGAGVVLTQQRLLEGVPQNGAKVICLDADWELVAREQRENVVSGVKPHNLAYVMYTSGSTGQPKGVSIPHRAVTRLVVSNEFIWLDPSERIAQVSNISFDAATFEIWGALLNGGRVVGITRDVALSPKDFAAELRGQGITSMFLTAALFNQLASEAPGAFGSLRTVIAGGEALDPKWVRAVLKNQPPQRLLNGYGPTENTTFTCCHSICDLGAEALNVPIGRPISNKTVFILDPHFNPVPIGIPGELYTGGDGLACGYWNRPELTSQKFVPNPFDADESSHLYRTGDLARFLPDGTIEFLGRMDSQVKIRGFRIELGEIENALSLHPAVRECVVTVWGTTSAEKRLVAYIVAREQTPNASDLRAFLAEKLPDHMIPSAFVQVNALPLTPNGKVDRKALPPPDQSRPKLDRQFIAPRDETEWQLAQIWESVLAVSPIGVQDKFFDLGGHSMLAVRVIAQIEKCFGRKLRLATLFQAPTIERLAAVLREEIKEGTVTSGTSLVEIQGAGSLPPLFLVHGAGGGMFWGYVNLSRHLGSAQPVYGFRSRGLEGLEEFSSIEAMASQYVADMRKVQPHGPYCLGGYCFGGNVAYEMACQLTEQGEKIGLLAILNCAPPNSSYSKIPWTPKWCLKFARNLFYWAHYFRHWSTTQRREFFRWKWQLLKKSFANKRPARNRDLTNVEPGDLVDLSSYTDDQKLIWETHIRGLMRFCPRPYRGRVHLFRSPGHPIWCSFDEHYGWGDLALGGVELSTVPGAHEKILEEPWVKGLAEKLSGALRRAEESNPDVPVSVATVGLPCGQKLQSRNKHRSVDRFRKQSEPYELSQTAPNTDEVSVLTELSPDVEAQQFGYWKRQLAGIAELLDLPADRPRPAQVHEIDGCYEFFLNGRLAGQVSTLATQQASDPFDIFLAAFAAVVQRYTGNDDVVIGSAARKCANNSSRAIKENLVPLRCDLNGDPSFNDLLGRLKSIRKEALLHSDVAFSRIVQELRPQASPSYAPVFQLFLSVETDPLSNQPGGEPIEALTKRIDLGIWLLPSEEGLSGRIKYNRALFDDSRIARFAEHFQTLLNSGVAEPEKRLSVLELLPEHEIEQLVREWNRTEAKQPKDKTLTQLFCEQVIQTPNAEALVWRETRLTYAQLHATASRLALRLKGLGVTNEALVGICVERTPEMVIAIFGTLLAGGAYVPLDPKYPKDRLAFTLHDAKVKVLLTQSSLLTSLPQGESTVLCLDSATDSILESATKPLLYESKESDLAYVIYTSGSTGKPKGVAIEHRNTVGLVSWAKNNFTSEELAGVLASTSICFDLSVFELFVPLCCGGTVILAENALELPWLAAAQEVRLINTVPSAIRELLRLRAVPPGVQVINLAGEPLSSELADQIYNETSVCKVFDLYGPTETTTYSTGSIRERGKAATIGRPLSNEHVYLFDPKMRLVPIGVPGELFIGGAGVARGYVNRPELTAEKFINDPFKPNGRLYRTGDLARWRADGNLEYLGRLDNQVKIRGFRIELGEIETVLKSHSGVAATVVVAREDNPGDKRLAAYVVPKAGVSLAENDLKQLIRAEVPDFMVPSYFVFLAAMPMTPNGKIDRKALPAPEARTRAPERSLVVPHTATEEKLAGLWREVLQLKEVSVEDNFFNLGGDSLLAVRVISGIREIFNVEVLLTSLLSGATIRSLARVVDRAAAQEGHTRLRSIKPAARGESMPLSYVQERLWFLNQLDPKSAAYNVPSALRLKGPLDSIALRGAVNALVSRHEALRVTFKYSDNGITQQIAQNLSLQIPTIDLEREPAQERESRAQDLINQHAREPFDLSTGPLIRVELFRLTERDHILLVVMHHSISDGWSLALFFEELGGLYDALAAGELPAKPSPLPIQYADFAWWQRQWMTGKVLEGELAHWKKVLAGAPPQVALPQDRGRPEQPSGRAKSCAACLSKEMVRKVTDFARWESCTPFMFFLTALMISLHKWTGQRDLVVGTVVAGRTRRELERLMGCFMNFLPLRAAIADSDTAGELLGRVRAAVLDGQTHQDCPFEKIVEALNPPRGRDQNPLYNVALLLQNFPENLLRTKTLQASCVPVSLESALLDLRFEIEQIQEGLSLTCEYKTDLFDADTVDAFLTLWAKVIERLVSAPETRVSAFELMSRDVGSTTPQEKIVIAATFTAEPVVESLQYWLRQLNVSAGLQFAPYHQVFQQLLDPQSILAENRRGLNVILARLDDWQRTHAPGENSADKLAHAIERSGQELKEAVKEAADRGSAPLLICFCPSSFGGPAHRAAVEEINRTHRQLEVDLEEISGVYVLTSDELAKWYPVTDYHDRAGEELGHVPYTPLFFTALGTALARKFHALKRAAYKVIALDCDNTLWSGVCGEDGPGGIRLDPPHRALQEFMRTQRDSGILLCLCSKNSEGDVHAVFSQRCEFPLQLKHFAGCRLNWGPKSANLRSLAQELGVGLDSFIFIDDNPVECAEVQANCPEVLTLHLPEDPALIPQFLNHCWVFDHLKLTKEDRLRGELYEQNRLREKLRAEAPTLEKFLAGLQLKVEMEAIAPADLARVSQLTQRTNQFNLTTRRRTEGEVSEWLTGGEGLKVRVKDRFGEYGLVGAVLYQVSARSLMIDTFLLSCRVLGRGIEHRILARLGQVARARDLEWVDLHFVPTAKNRPALDFLEQLGCEFKQPLNGCFVFRLPVSVAAEVTFHPSAQCSLRKDNQSQLPGSEARAPISQTVAFNRWREIALDANEPYKIHQAVLTAAPVRKRAQGNYQPPGNELERKLCQLWQELLHIEPVGMHDDFFELGGHSLLAVRLFAEIEKIVGRKFPLVTLFQAPTIAQLAQLVLERDSASSLLVPIQPNGDKAPLFLVHGAGGDVLWGYANLVTHLPTDRPVFGIKSRIQDGPEAEARLEDMARSYLEVVRTRQPEGPYYLGGYCFGGNVAYEMARQLKMQGQQVTLVVLIDTAPANAGYEKVAWFRPSFPWRFSRNLCCWLADFMALEREERRRFVGRKLRWLGRKLRRRMAFKNSPTPFDLEEVIDLRHFPEQELKLWQIHLEALIRHVERPYSGRVALLRTRGQPLFCSFEDDFCWGRLVDGGVSVRLIPGSHENIFMEPNVRVLASELMKLLLPAHASGAKSALARASSAATEAAPGV